MAVSILPTVPNLTADIAHLLGGSKVLRRKISSESELIGLLREGLPYASVEAAMETLGISQEQIAAYLAVPGRTLARRKREQRLNVDESDRLYRLARITATALNVFGEEEKARRWLLKPNRALGGETPLALLDTDAGARQVEEVLGRIEHGVVS
jgi:putative toxin-antitoxin system antitoxin component (TIGR02293 family)